MQAALPDRSPHLRSVLLRCYEPAEAQVLIHLLELALDAGGGEEPFFERSAEARFNPRAARLPLLVIESGAVEFAAVAAAILFTARPVSQMLDVAESWAGPRSRQILVLAAGGSFWEATSTPPDSPDRAAALVASAAHLDDVRHLHMALAAGADRSAIEERASMTERYIQLTRSISPPLHLRLKAWHERWINRRELAG